MNQVTTSQEPIWWDPFHNDDENPYLLFKRMRDECPLYYNEKHNFYALSRYEDCEKGLMDRETFVSKHGAVVEIIKSGMVSPSGWFIFTDPPVHPVWRALFNKTFTPKRMKLLEPQIRAFCARCLDPHIGSDRFDFVHDLGAELPMRVIGMLMGIPESDQETHRQRMDDQMRNDTYAPKPITAQDLIVEEFSEYLDYRVKHPADDLMTELLNLEFTDEHGVHRKLERPEILTICHLFASAGNETTNRLIGFIGKLLGEHPDQRRQVHADRSLLFQTVEEVLRYESPAPNVARMNVRDVEFHGQTIPAGSAVAFITSSGNHDERMFEDPDTFNIHRDRKPHLTFGFGWHSCIGNPLARLEGEIALDEVLNRWRDWEVDYENVKFFNTSTVRGYDSMPVLLGRGG